MENGIQQLIDKEKEAEERIKTAILESENASKKAMQDAELILSAIQLENDKAIKNMKKDNEVYIEKIRKELKEEYHSYAKLINSKDLTTSVLEICDIISGKNKKINI